MPAHHVNELGEFEAEFDSEGLTEVCDGPDEAVVIVEKIVVQPLGVRVALHTCTAGSGQVRAENNSSEPVETVLGEPN